VVHDAQADFARELVRKPGVEAAQIVRHLKSRNIIAAPRQGWVRVSPHFYIAPEDIDRLLEELTW
jgi:selenocysteine lyase/cysteine desulfurase